MWVPANRENTLRLSGEVGILVQVFASKQIHDKCFLVIDHNGQRYVGTLMFDDPSFCVQIVHVLRSRTGHSIQEIGDVEVI
jgi:hypothetical protein